MNHLSLVSIVDRSSALNSAVVVRSWSVVFAHAHVIAAARRRLVAAPLPSRGVSRNQTHPGSLSCCCQQLPSVALVDQGAARAPEQMEHIEACGQFASGAGALTLTAW